MWIRNGSPFDSIREAVFTVSPNKQYLGIVKPTTPATTGPVIFVTYIYVIFIAFNIFSQDTIPVWIPMRNLRVSWGLWAMVWCFTALSSSRDIDAISPACLFPFFIGKPETWQKRCIVELYRIKKCIEFIKKVYLPPYRRRRSFPLYIHHILWLCGQTKCTSHSRSLRPEKRKNYNSSHTKIYILFP